MEVYNISRKLYESLIRYETNTLNTESELFIVPEKNKWNNNHIILKRFSNTKGDYFGNKLYTINSLINSKDKIGIEEIVFPDKLAIHNKEIIGITMKLINGVNLDYILSNSNYTPTFKKELLIQVGQILNKLKSVRIYNNIKDFFIGDLHEGNFVYNFDTKEINVVDMDSCKINGNKPFPSKYLYRSKITKELSHKYKTTDNLYFPEYIPDENTDYFCYIMMILNYLSGTVIEKMNYNEYYTYLDYLNSLGYNLELLTIFENVYSNKDNTNPVDYLDTLPNDYKTLALSNYNVYKTIKK